MPHATRGSTAQNTHKQRYLQNLFVHRDTNIDSFQFIKGHVQSFHDSTKYKHKGYLQNLLVRRDTDIDSFEFVQGHVQSFHEGVDLPLAGQNCMDVGLAERVREVKQRAISERER
jgi:hypothetical protein